MYESQDLQFFRTITEIHSGADDFEESRLVTIFLINLRAARILYFFKVFLEGMARKKITVPLRLEF